MGLKKAPPPPPAWEQFPFLKRYHGGIRTLVEKESNKPEYPLSAEDDEIKRLEDAAEAQKKMEDKNVADEKGFGKRAIPARTERFNPFANSSTEYAPAVKCYLDSKSRLEAPQLLAYMGRTKGFPDPVMGSHSLLGLRDDVCFERYGRLAPYGFGYSRKFGGSGAGMEGEREGAEAIWDNELEIDWRDVRWAEAQQACIEANAHRFKQPSEKAYNHFFNMMPIGGPVKDAFAKRTESAGAIATTKSVSLATGTHSLYLSSSAMSASSDVSTHSPSLSSSTASATSTTISRPSETKSAVPKKLLSRTAVIIRTWWDFQYDSEDLFYIRALINELTIQSGGEYTIHFLIHVKDDNRQIWADEYTYQKTLNDSLPEEFRGMGTLWSERQMGLIYGGVAESFYRDLPVHGAYRSTYMPVQYFAHMHPEYDFFWHWEMDIRYTGHFYHLFDRVSKWAKEQPRKGLWERNGRFYVPSEHGSWEDFRQMVRVQTEHGTASHANKYAKVTADAGRKDPMDEESRMPEKPIWGPLPPTGDGDSIETEDDPQPPSSYDKDNYEWGVGEEADFITFNPLFDPSGTNWILAEDTTGYNTTNGYPPRRTAIITASRLSRRLLETMHRETAMKRHTMFSEMWPGSCALHHGYKAVYAPHPVYIDRAWPTSYLAAIFNNGRNGAAGGARTSVFSDERQHNFLGTTWYYHAGFSPNLWKRWLGYKVDNDGGEEYEIANEGRMCVPAMLLHPVKQVDLVYEHQVGE